MGLGLEADIGAAELVQGYSSIRIIPENLEISIATQGP